MYYDFTNLQGWCLNTCLFKTFLLLACIKRRMLVLVVFSVKWFQLFFHKDQFSCRYERIFYHRSRNKCSDIYMTGPLTENVSFEVATYFSGWQIRATQKRKCFDALGALQFSSLQQLFFKYLKLGTFNKLSMTTLQRCGLWNFIKHWKAETSTDDVWFEIIGQDK